MAEFIHLGFDQIRQNASGNVAILRRQLEVLWTLATGPGARVCKKPVLQQAEAIEALYEQTLAWEPDREPLRELLRSIHDALGVDRDKDRCRRGRGDKLKRPASLRGVSTRG